MRLKLSLLALITWIGACAPAHKMSSIPNEPKILEMPLNYQTLETQILVRCASCHLPGGKATEILFHPYSTLISDESRWKAPGAKSRIVRSLSRSDKNRMPPPGDSGPLTQDQIEFVVRWIDAGRPEF